MENSTSANEVMFLLGRPTRAQDEFNFSSKFELVDVLGCLSNDFKGIVK